MVVAFGPSPPAFPDLSQCGTPVCICPPNKLIANPANKSNVNFRHVHNDAFVCQKHVTRKAPNCYHINVLLNILKAPLVSQTLRESWPRGTLKVVLRGVQQDVERERNEEYFEVFNAPYIQRFSESLQRKLRKVQIGFVPKKQETMCTQLCKRFMYAQ